MKKRTKDRILNGSIVVITTAPFWLTAVFAIANVHDEITIDRDGNILDRIVTRDDYRELGAFSFDKTGQVYKSCGFGNFNSYRFTNDNYTHIHSNIALPKSGILANVEKIHPTHEELLVAHRYHRLACNVVKVQKLNGYGKLNCQFLSLTVDGI